MRGVRSASAVRLACILATVDQHAPTLSRPRPACRLCGRPRRKLAENNNHGACPFGRCRTLSDCRHLHHLARLQDRGRGHRLRRFRRTAVTGRGECVPYRHYGETMESVAAAIESVRAAIEARLRPRRSCRACCRQVRHATRSTARCGTSRRSRPGKAWRQPDLHGGRRPRSSPPTRCRSERRRRWRRRRAPMPAARCSRSRSAAKATSSASGRSSRPRPTAASSSTPMKAGRDANIAENLAAAAELGVALIEQPLPAGRDAILAQDRPSRADLRRRKRAHGRRPAGARRASTTPSTSSSTRPAG